MGRRVALHFVLLARLVYGRDMRGPSDWELDPDEPQVQHDVEKVAETRLDATLSNTK